MPANTSPIFTLTPVVAIAQVSAANTNRDGTGTVVDVMTGAANASRIEMVTVKAVGTTTAGMVRLYIYNGSTTSLWKEIQVSAITPASATLTFEYEVARFDGRGLLELPSGYKIQASTHNAETFKIIAQGGDY